MRRLWAGIDCGFFQMSVAVIDESDRVLAVEQSIELSLRNRTNVLGRTVGRAV